MRLLNRRENNGGINKLAKTKILRHDGVWVDVYFALLTKEDLSTIHKPEWGFRWSEDYRKERVKVYKMCIEETDKIEGLISLEMRSNFVLAWHNEKPYYETNRDYDKVVAALLAFACKLSLEDNGTGYVGFEPKTKLIDYYLKIGAKQLPGKNMAIHEIIAKQLINQYYGNT